MERKEKAISGQGALTMRSIFRCMMEDGYYPIFEQTHILFMIDDNTAVLEYEEGIVSIRIFFSVEEEAYQLFMEASNATMMSTFIVKPAMMDDRQNIMFSFEMMCDTLKEFRKFLPRAVQLIIESVMIHKSEMKRLILSQEAVSTKIPNTDDVFGIVKVAKPLS